MSAISDLYDAATPVENAVRTVFEAAGVTCWTPLADPEFQKARPRVEAILLPGAALGHLLPLAGRRTASGHMREQAWRSQLSLSLFTKADILEHRSFVAQIQFVLDTAAYAMNATDQLPNHAIAAVRCTTPGSLEFKPEDGMFIFRRHVDVDYSVKEAAWAALE